MWGYDKLWIEIQFRGQTPQRTAIYVAISHKTTSENVLAGNTSFDDVA